jgi:hypothetical protein
MLYSDNAPELECALHSFLSHKRVNMVNPRKEFYRDVALEEIEAFVLQCGLSAHSNPLTLGARARRIHHDSPLGITETCHGSRGDRGICKSTTCLLPIT